MYRRKRDFEHMDRLAEYLDDYRIDYDRYPKEDGQALVVRDNDGTYLWDVVLFFGSYGEEDDLLEASGISLLGHDDVEGHMTAEDVIELIENPREGCRPVPR